MACSYISSNDNRFYAALEESYGVAPALSAQNRFPAVKLATEQRREKIERKDKTGGRTFFGIPTGVRKQTRFELRTYLTGWPSAGQEPGYGPLFHAALGGGPWFFAGGTAGAASTASVIQFSAQHGLTPGQAVTCGDELRFVAAIVDESSVQLNAPLSGAPAPGTTIGATAGYTPATGLQSVTLFDYWSPSGVVQRLLRGAAIDKLRIAVNGDYHEFSFQGAAADLIDSSSFAEGQGGLAAYPAEPELAAFDYSIIPGHLGQAWLGTTPDRFFTLTEGMLELDNDLDLRNREFGSDAPRCIAAGMRTVTVSFSVFEQDNDATRALYQAARQRSPISVMFQLGQQAGQLFGVYLKAVVPEVPAFDDSETRLQWQFQSCRAQGTGDDEIFVAFG